MACALPAALQAIALALCTAQPVLGQAIAGSAAQAQTPASAHVPLGKLPDSVKPLRYRLDLTVDPAKESFSGTVDIDVELSEPATTIYLHGRNLAIRRAAALWDGQVIAGEWKELDPTGVAALTFSAPLAAGRVTLAFSYQGQFNDSPAGMFRVKVGQDWYSWTQFESIDARSAFPSFDQPSFKTPFSVVLRTPPGQVAVSNAPEVSTSRQDGLDVHRFAETLPLPTYLVAMMTGPFAMVQGEVSPTPQRPKPLPLRIVSTRPNAGQLQFALDGTRAIVPRLEAYFGEPFPFPKLDQITSPIMPGAMENAGADNYQDAILVMDEDAPTDRKRRFGMVVSHELGHQWFGDLVTPAWWDDIWLNESFANWIGYRVGSEWRPDLNIASGALAEGFAAMDTDALVAGRPIRQPIENSARIDASFDAITYGKGGHVIAMIAAFMGDEKFQAGVRRYMAAHRFGNASSIDFFAAMADAAGDPQIVPALQGFVEQQGVPLLTFASLGRGYRVTQSRYAPFGASPPATSWSVPMCLRRGSQRQCSMLTGQSAEIGLPGSGALVPNADGAGYYRFELPKHDWDALIRIADRLPGGEAQALSDSLVASFRAGRAGVPQLAALARKLVRNPDSYASAAALDGLSGLVNDDMVDQKDLPAYRRFVTSLYMPAIEENGFDPRAGAYAHEKPESFQRRAQAAERLASLGRGTQIDTVLANAARSFMAGNAAALDPAWFDLALKAHIARGGLDAAKSLLDKALASQDPVFRPAALAALAGSGKEEVARWLLDQVTDDRLRPNERRTLMRGVVQTAATREFGYGWFRRHLDELLAGNGGIFFSARLPQMLGGFCSIERANEFARDLRPRFKGGTGELEMERTIERVRNCGMLRDARRAEVSAAIAKLR
jgi:aminopeptidase N